MFKHRYPDHRTQYHFIKSIPYNMPFKMLLTSVDDPMYFYFCTIPGGPLCVPFTPFPPVLSKNHVVEFAIRIQTNYRIIMA